MGTMSKQAGDAPLRVEVPSAQEDRPAWVKVGVIAVVGFAVGVAWPRLAGIRPGPTSPADAASAAAASASAAPRAPESSAPTSASLTAPAASSVPAAPASAVAVATGAPNVMLSRGAVISCKNEDGETLKGAAACGGLGGLDAIAQPHLRKIAQCPAAEGMTGKVPLILTVDFAGGRVGLDIGKSKEITNRDGLLTCMRPHVIGIRPGNMTHEHPRYTVIYTATLSAPDTSTGAPSASGGHAGGTPGVADTPASSGGGASASDSPTAQVVWEVALVRDAPRTGQIVGRLQRGSKVHVSAGPQEGWYKVQFGGATEGWVYRGAIGR